MNERDELIEILHQEATADRVKNSHLRHVPVVAAKVEAAADAILAAGYSRRRIVSAVEDLETLPAMAHLYSTKTDNSWVWLPKKAPALVAWGTGGGYTYETDFIKFEAPLTVLFEPEES